VEEKKPLILCLQETKLAVCDDKLNLLMWGDSNHAYSFRPSVGASGGLLTVWDTLEVEVWSSVSQDNVLIIHGKFIRTNEVFFIFNVYAPCEVRARQHLWSTLSVKLQLIQGNKVCVCGDFNAIRRPEERRPLRGAGLSQDLQHFSQFIDDNGLIDLPLCGRRFTWFKGDGTSMSRIDRFLLSEEWCIQWPNCLQVALLRSLSDHCPLQLSVDEENWGPRPSRMLKCWQDAPGYKKFVIEKWQSFEVEGWSGYVLREKLRLIKLALKEWHSVHAKNLPGKIVVLKQRLSELDEVGAVGELSEGDTQEMRCITHDLHSLSRVSASISWQQSRIRWLKDGDENSKYFHSALVRRRRRNAIVSLMVNDTLVEGVQPIRTAVFSHFRDHFEAPRVSRPGAENLTFNTLSHVEGTGLIKPFSEAEVKAAIWDCESFKSPGPNGVNFGFIKDFWEQLKGDVMHFISDFHRNGKLVRGINNTFIALIPKVDSPQRLNDFRPISLVGCLYKILSKVLANRLRMVVGKVISDTQSAFVKDRQILD